MNNSYTGFDDRFPDRRFVAMRGDAPEIDRETGREEFPTGHPRLKLLQPSEPGHPGIGLIAPETPGVFHARFCFELKSVCQNFDLSSTRHRAISSRAPDFAVSQRACDSERHGAYWNRLFARMGPGQELRIRHFGWRDRWGKIRYRCLIEGSVTAAAVDRAVQSATDLIANLLVVLPTAAPAYRFQPLSTPLLTSAQSDWRATVRPLGVRLTLDSERRIGYFSETKAAKQTICLLGLPAPVPSLSLEAPVVAARHSAIPIEVCIKVRAVQLTAGAMEDAADALKVLVGDDISRIRYEESARSFGSLPRKTMEALAAALEPWLSFPQGFSVGCEVSSSKRVPEAFLEAVGQEVFATRPVVIEGVDMAQDSMAPLLRDVQLDLRCVLHISGERPPLLPLRECLLEAGFPKHYGNPEVELLPEGIVLGDAIVGRHKREMRIAPGDRSRHVYVLGATGTGKSTLLFNMITQDIARGAGVGLIDPHGDLFEQVINALPPARARQVVVMDLADLDHTVGLNFLECPGPHVTFQRGYVINELLKIFQRLYRDIPESMGPAFEQYMRNSLALLMGDPRGDVTLVDVARVFEDREYRNYLKRNCQDPLVKGFWEGIAERVTGDNSIANMAPYVTNKFNRFMFNPAIRAIVGQSRSTIDFKAIMDHGRVLLINLSKGVIGEADTEFLGMLIMGKLFGAAMSRATQQDGHRRPFFLYVDEFQNFTTSTVSLMLSEARKYGLCLTLANQNMAQLESSLQESVMGNVGTRLFFRIGANDAASIERYVTPHLRTEDMLTLPDHVAAGRLLAGNTPTPPIVFETRSAVLSPDSQEIQGKRVAELKGLCTQAFSRSVAEVEAEIASRRTAYRGDSAVVETVSTNPALLNAGPR